MAGFSVQDSVQLCSISPHSLWCVAACSLRVVAFTQDDFDEPVIGLTGTMLSNEAVGLLVGALRSLPCDAADEPETLEVLRVQMSESVQAVLQSAGV